MPGGNGMGPMGMGRMTGRGAGFCAGYGVPGFANPGPGMGMGRGMGFGGGGRGRRNMFYATGMPGWARMGAGVWPVAPAADAASQAQALKMQAQSLEQTLQAVRERLAELEGAKPS